jgi:hypothetical protein
MPVLRILSKEEIEQQEVGSKFTVWYTINCDPKTIEDLTEKEAKFFCESLEKNRIWDYTLYQIISEETT